MRNFPLKTVGIFAALIGVVVLFNTVVLKGSVERIFSAAIGGPGGYAFEKVRLAGSWFQGIGRWNEVIRENDELRRSQADLLARVARVADLETENVFLRSAADIAEKFPGSFIPAGLFAVVADAGGHHATVNQGSQSGIRVGDAVISGEGILVGQVIETADSFARVRLVTDPAFEITGNVLGGTTTGIVRGNLSKGLLFDLIAQEEEITEGDQIVSTGNDRFPSALVIGQVEHVNTSETQLFKEVRIKPAMQSVATGRVIVLTHP